MMTLLPVLFLLAVQIKPEVAGTVYRQPQVAAGYGQVGVAFGGGSCIYYAGSKDGGRSFGKPVKVAEVGALALGRHRGPRIAFLPDAVVISAVAGERKSDDPHAHGLPAAGDLQVWRSTDHGQTWQRAGTVNDVQGAAREGLHTMTADKNGRLFAAWLDLREKGTRLYGARSDDGGLTWSKNFLVYESPDGTICQCCHPTSLFEESGQVWTMWRNAVAGSRDFYAARTEGETRFTEAHKLGTGTWKLDACPMDGGGFAIDHGKVLSAWRREDTVFLAVGDESEKAIGKGKDVALAKTKRGVTAAWSKGEGLEVLLPGAAEATSLSDRGSFVTLLGLPDESVLAAWETKEGDIQLTRIEH